MLRSLSPAQQVIKIVNEELTALMGGEHAKLELGGAPRFDLDGRPSRVG